MGRQINFFLHQDDQDEFDKLLKSFGEVVLLPYYHFDNKISTVTDTLIRDVRKEGTRVYLVRLQDFKDIKLHRIEAGVEPGNRRSIRLAKSLGMRREGLKKRAIFLRGEWRDLLMFTLTSEDLGIKFNSKTALMKPR